MALRFVLLVALAFSLTLTPRSARADALYGLGENHLYTIHPTTGGQATVGWISGGPTGLAVRDGRLYTYQPSTRRLLRIDPAAAAILETIDIGVDRSSDNEVG